MQRIDLDIRLGGHQTTEGTMEAVPRGSRERTGKALGTLAIFVALAAGAFFIPPHIPWVVLALGAGAFLSIRQLRSEYVVESFSGSCPRCGAALPLERGEQVRFPLKLTCFECHHEPVLTPRETA